MTLPSQMVGCNSICNISEDYAAPNSGRIGGRRIGKRQRRLIEPVIGQTQSNQCVIKAQDRQTTNSRCRPRRAIAGSMRTEKSEQVTATSDCGPNTIENDEIEVRARSRTSTFLQ